ncbi:MAG: folate family ECF transporter S component, partial [Clostridia bacterium]|nr:folate family ECF transporter S component [Clostridia bacterium]
MWKLSPKSIAVLGVLLGCEIILSRFLSISTPVVKIGFAFIPVVIAAVLYGPVWSGVIAGAGDLLGALLFPIGPFFPGYTLSACLSGVIFGIVLYEHKPGLLRSLAAVALSLTLCSLMLDTLWLLITT